MDPVPLIGFLLEGGRGHQNTIIINDGTLGKPMMILHVFLPAACWALKDQMLTATHITQLLIGAKTNNQTVISQVDMLRMED